jgi:hypothetical protein
MKGIHGSEEQKKEREKTRQIRPTRQSMYIPITSLRYLMLQRVTLHIIKEMIHEQHVMCRVQKLLTVDAAVNIVQPSANKVGIVAN